MTMATANISIGPDLAKLLFYYFSETTHTLHEYFAVTKLSYQME